jgi:phospholipid/cholesterol/gamma-HCH transport system substrate-binding protein
MTDLGQAAADLRKTSATVAGMSNRLAGTQAHLDNFLQSGDSVLMKVNAGHGTIGRLVNDSSLYVSTDSLVTALRGLIADVRANPKRYFGLKIF